MMHLVDELQLKRKWLMHDKAPRVHCKVFEDNPGCCEWAALPKMRPQTKYLGIRLHHFREHVRLGKITIRKIPTECQLADLATKTQPEQLFIAQRETLIQWTAEDMSRNELDRRLTTELLPSSHLRACEIIEHAEALIQHASLSKAPESKQVSA